MVAIAVVGDVKAESVEVVGLVCDGVVVVVTMAMVDHDVIAVLVDFVARLYDDVMRMVVNSGIFVVDVMVVVDAVVVDDDVAEDEDALVVASDAAVLFSGPLDPIYVFKCSHHGPFLSYTYLL